MTSTLILSRTNGAVVRASGLISAAQPDPDGTTTQDIASTAPSVNGNGAENGDREQRGGKSVGLKSAQDVAKLVWRLFGGAGEVVDDMMGVEDEVRLLRLRTKRNEIVIVPGRWASIEESWP